MFHVCPSSTGPRPATVYGYRLPLTLGTSILFGSFLGLSLALFLKSIQAWLLLCLVFSYWPPCPPMGGSSDFASGTVVSLLLLFENIFLVYFVFHFSCLWVIEIKGKAITMLCGCFIFPRILFRLKYKARILILYSWNFVTNLQTLQKW